MKDKFQKVKGYFKIEAIKDGIVIDEFEKENLIMDEARFTFAKLLANINAQPVVDKFVLGTMGHVGNDVLVPKNESNGFVSSRDMLFSEESGAQGVDFDSITFTVTGVSGSTVTASDGLSTVKTTVNGTEVEYIIEIHNNSMNGTGTMIFTECAFYTGSEIFSMRTFKGKIKDDTVALRVTWKIIF